MIDPALVSAVLVTKGDVDLSAILASIEEAGITNTIVWDNSKRPDLSCYGRYAGIAEAKSDYVFHQDDDLIAPVAEILKRYRLRSDRYSIVANNRLDEAWPLTAMGVVFHRSLADCFKRYIKLYGEDADFHRVSDVIFAYQHSYRRVWLGYEDLPWQTAPDRMHLQYDHYEVRERARLRTLALPERWSP